LSAAIPSSSKLHIDRLFGQFGCRTFAGSIDLNASCVQMRPRWRTRARSGADMQIAPACNPMWNVVRMNPQAHANAGGFRRRRTKHDQAAQQREKKMGMAGSFTVSCVCPLVSPSQPPVRPIRQNQGRRDQPFSGSNRRQLRYRPG